MVMPACGRKGRKMELIIPFDSQSDSPLYEQIYQYIKNEIRRGKLEAGSRLPSTRILARNLRLSRSTTQMAYDQLLSEGYIEALPCKGYFVCKIEELVEVRQKGGGSFVEPGDTGKDRYEVDFSPRGIDLDSFPFNTWRKISRNTLVDDNKEMFAAGDPQGERALRTAIGAYLHSARGVDCRPEQILIGAGSEYLLMLLPQILGNGRKIAMENPTYKQAYRVLRGEGYPVIPVDMDRYGMDVERLACSSADVAYVMPSHQYPLGIVMPIKRRLALLKWANEQEGRYIIEDDYDSEFRYKGKPIPALQGYDSCDKVIYMGTFSKSIAPAIRMSYMVLPKSLLVLYQEKSSFLNSTVSKVDQLILQKFIEEGYYERHLNKTRALYKSRHDTLLGCLKSLQDRCVISGENAGVHLLLHFHNHMAEDELTARAAQKGVRVYGLTEYYIEPQVGKQATILLGYANMNEEKIQEAVRILDEAWK